MAATEGVVDIGHHPLHLFHLARSEGFGLGKAVAEPAAHGFAAHQLLIAAHVDPGGIRLGIGIIFGIDIDQLDHPVGIGAAGGDEEGGGERAGEGHVGIEHIGLVGEHVGAGGGEALIFHHVLARHPRGLPADVGHGLGGIADVLVEFGACRLGWVEGEAALGL